MPLSSNTLIHLTRDKVALLGILEDNFKINFCRERFVFGGSRLTARIPMVSFCDIPLSEIKNHIDSYGEYGIGLTKEWATKNGLNPVLYIEPKSLLANSYKQAFKSFVIDDPSDNISESQACLVDVARYVKNYQGKLERKSGTRDQYRFSDEREWRYVPPRSDFQDMLTTDTLSEGEREAADIQIAGLRLHFEPNDIKYIIIRDDSEISEFIHHLRTSKGAKYSYQDVERLTTRILTAEQIRGDI